MSSPTLEYSARTSKEKGAIVSIALSFTALDMSVAVAVYSFSRMDSDRLFWEGGHQYFLKQFPFALVLGLASLGIASGVVCAVIWRRCRSIAILAVICNVLWAAWWARHLFR